jgi:hypothetical protein
MTARLRELLLAGNAKGGSTDSQRATLVYHRCMKASAPVVLALLLPLGASAETFRCGKWIVGEQITREELVQKCGEPTSRASRTEDVRAPNQYTGGNVKVGETVIETWIYERGTGAAPMVVTLVDGKIRSIERQGK